MDDLFHALNLSWQTFLSDDSEVWADDVLGYLTDIRFLADQHGDAVGVMFTANTAYGPFTIDTDSCVISDSHGCRRLPEDLCGFIHEQLRDAYGW